MRPHQTLAFFTLGQAIIVVAAALMFSYPARQLEINVGMFLSLLLLWSIPLAMLVRRRRDNRKPQRSKDLPRVRNCNLPCCNPNRPRMGGRLLGYAGLGGQA